MCSTSVFCAVGIHAQNMTVCAVIDRWVLLNACRDLAGVHLKVFTRNRPGIAFAALTMRWPLQGLLAPTGKARVCLSQETRHEGEVQTIAQFMLGLDRYNVDHALSVRKHMLDRVEKCAYRPLGIVSGKPCLACDKRCFRGNKQPQHYGCK